LLHQLADYYQQLQEYHQQAAAAAAQQLAHLQCLLPSPRQAVLTTEVAREGQAALDKAASQPTLLFNPEGEMPRMASWLEIEDTLEEGRGKMLHLGFIVRKLYGRLPPDLLAPVTERTRQQLAEGARAGKWFAVPDSPDCWTIDLREFPDWAEEEAGEEAEPEAEEEAVPMKKFSPPEMKEVSFPTPHTPHPTPSFKSGEEAAIPASALPTKQACKRLGISHYRLNDDRLKYAEQLQEGVHYFRSSQRTIYWSEEGIARVKQLRQADPLTRKGSRR
jgi:hypothetical protein